MSNYTKTEKLLHKLYLSNYFISKASLELEQSVFGTKSNKIEIEEFIFVTGLARSGTTAMTNWIFNSKEYSSLQYANMPFLFLPNLWRNSKNIDPQERSHKDGIIIDNNSPEEFDEYFWKVFLNDSYISEYLEPHIVNEETIRKYLSYVSLVCLSKNKQKYICKNNNNILRLNSLNKINGSKTIIMFRDPASHSNSLLNLHKKVSSHQENERFILDYFNFLGHHEFGLNHKPFLLNKSIKNKMVDEDKNGINYWLLNWINYHEYLLENHEHNYILISFNDLINKQETITNYLNQNLHLHSKLVIQKKHNPSKYPDVSYDIDLLEVANEIFTKLEALRKYE